MAIRYGDEDLALFVDMRRHEKDQGVSSLTGSNNGNSGSGASSVARTDSCIHSRRTAVEMFLYSENEKSDYDWLLAHEDTPNIDKEPLKNSTNQLRELIALPTGLKSRLEIILEEPVSKSNTTSKLPNRASELSSSSTTAVKGTSMSVEPKSFSVPNCQATEPAITKPLRSSTPSSRATLPFAKPTVSHTKSAIATRSTARSSTDGRPFLSASKPTSRSSTSTSALALARSSSVSMSLPTARIKTSKPSEISGFSLEARPNLRISLPERPVSASRFRETPCAKLAAKTRISGRPRQQSKSSDDVNPVLMGSKIVERVVNMRKLGPPKQDDHNAGGKSASFLNSSGFGRSLSRSSLDMALRHMDIRRSISGNVPVTMNKLPVDATCKDRSSGSSRGRTATASEGSETQGTDLLER